jgi:ribonucleoside-diphosphate reductase alpha chain
VNKTKYSDGILPIDTYKKDIDSLTSQQYNMDWESLRHDLKTYGIRNATLMAQMPVESSSKTSNSTNGVEPPRAFIEIKEGIPQVITGFTKYKNKYQLLWDLKSTHGYLKICSIINKFLDQSGSWNTSYNPKHYNDEKIPMSVLLSDLLLSYKLGLKTLYYNNTNNLSGEIKTDENDCPDGVCKL